jgi:LysM repeat protein
MNNPSPLVPQGSLLEQKNQSRARVKIAVFVVLAVHGIGLLALLMQGCKKEPETTATPLIEGTNPPPAFVEPTNAPVVDTNPASATSPPGAETAPPPLPTVPASDYTIVAGDNLTTIARKFHVSLKALTDANPGLEPTRLKVGQTIHIPAPTATNSVSSGTTPTVDTAAGEQVYTVKSGDNLTKIATEFKVSVKALRSANNLTTDRIRVGQKLKIPAKAAAPAEPAPPPPATATPTGQ